MLLTKHWDGRARHNYRLLVLILRRSWNGFTQRRTWSLQPAKCIRNCKLHPSNVTLRICRTTPWVNDKSHEPTRIIVQFLTTDHSIVSLQRSFVLFLHCQRFVVSHCIGKFLIRFCNLARVVRHNGTRGLWEVTFWVQAWKCRASNDYLITSAVYLKLELVWYPLAAESVNLVELIHFCILSPQCWLRLSCPCRVEKL